MYAFALERRWVVRHVIVIVVCALFVLAGFWQIHRLHERRAHNAQIRRGLAQPPADLAKTSAVTPYRRATATGRYDTRNEVLLRSRVLDDNSGSDVLTPLVLPDGRAVLVDRGWIPLEISRPRDHRTAPRANRVTISGVMLPPEKKRPLTPDDPKGGHLDSVSYAHVARIARQVPYPLASNYLLLQKQRPAQRDLPRYEQMQPLTDGPHLGYAVQWFLFFTVSVIGYGALLRREAQKYHRITQREGPAGG